MGSLSPVHWIIVIVVVLLLFGPGRLAGVGKGLGEGIRSFKKGLADDPPEEEKGDNKQLADKAERSAEGGRREHHDPEGEPENKPS